MSYVDKAYTDYEGRAFVVVEHNPGALDGREFVGVLSREGKAPLPCACDGVTFKEVWLERKRPTTGAEQEEARKRRGL